jgi:hypothetical protein
VPPHVLLSSERQDWRTPEWFLDLVRLVFPIGLDPCAGRGNPARARLWGVQHSMSPPGAWAGPTLDGLVTFWARAITDDEGFFANPPYGPHLSGEINALAEIWRKNRTTGEREIIGHGTGWGEKIAREFEAGAQGLVLVPVRTETAWWQRIHGAADLTLFWSSPDHGSRISFVNPDTGKPVNGSNLASTVFYRQGQSTDGLGRFVRTFAPHGTIVPGGNLKWQIRP